MPVVRIEYSDVEELIGIDIKTFLDRLPMIGADIERIEEDYVDVEFFPNRPDMYSVEGVARAMRGFLDIETGLPKYDVKPPLIEIVKDESILNIRPYIVCGVVRGVEFTDSSIRSLMELQEDLHWAIGRDRKKVSIGVHDLSRIKPPFKYTTVPANFEFIPLDFDEPMSIERILKEHPKGVKYGHILEDFDRYPIIIDANGEALSFPPIINGVITRVTEESKELFIDVTGTDKSVHTALNIMVTSLAERGATLEAVRVAEVSGDVMITPNLSAKKKRIKLDEVNSLIGLKLGVKEVVKALERMRYGVEVEKEIVVHIPPYRADIMHSWDIIEDVAIGYGYENVPCELPNVFTVGEAHPISIAKKRVREIMTGMGFLEVMPFSLTCEKIHYEYMRRKSNGRETKVLHPLTQEHTMICTDLMPSLLHILSLNKHREMPQRIFCVGDVLIDEKTIPHLAFLSCHAEANFTEAKSYVITLFREIDTEFSVDEGTDPAFIEGRQAVIIVDEKEVGRFGEIHPEVLSNFSLDHPALGFEMELMI
ncbi:phenylalanine--tRNA ligase subunit beta [Methanosarcinales archaeon]|nr:MAG: phenylalanine--tRNA ligase subunit beta [Methanosarcinales archaeon]